MKTLVTLSALALASAVKVNHQEHYAKLVSKMSLSSLPAFDLQATPEEEACGVAWLQFDYVVNNHTSSGCPDLDPLYHDDTLTEQQTNALLTDFCTTERTFGAQQATCVSAFRVASLNLYDKCAAIIGVDDPRWAALHVIVQAVTVNCMKDATDATKFCFTSVKKLGTLGDAPTPVQLDGVCNPCVERYLKALALIGNADTTALTALLSLACTKYNGDYCAVKFQVAADPAKEGAALTTARLQEVCHPCVTVWLVRFVNLVEALNPASTDLPGAKAFLAVQSFACQKDADNNYCIPKFEAYDIENKLTPCGNDIATRTSCTAECQSAFQSYINEMGCCSRILIDFLRFQYLYNRAEYNPLLPAPLVLENWLTTKCSKPLPSRCTGSRLRIALTILNLDPDWVAAHQVEFKAIIVKAIQYAIGQSDEADVLVGDIVDATIADSTAGAQSVTVTLQSTTNGFVANIEVSAQNQAALEAQYQALTQNQDFSFISALPLEARAQPTDPLIVSSSTYVQNSGVAHLVPSVFALLGSFLCLRFLF